MRIASHFLNTSVYLLNYSDTFRTSVASRNVSLPNDGPTEEVTSAIIHAFQMFIAKGSGLTSDLGSSKTLIPGVR